MVFAVRKEVVRRLFSVLPSWGIRENVGTISKVESASRALHQGREKSESFSSDILGISHVVFHIDGSSEKALG